MSHVVSCGLHDLVDVISTRFYFTNKYRCLDQPHLSDPSRRTATHGLFWLRVVRPIALSLAKQTPNPSRSHGYDVTKANMFIDYCNHPLPASIFCPYASQKCYCGIVTRTRATYERVNKWHVAIQYILQRLDRPLWQTFKHTYLLMPIFERPSKGISRFGTTWETQFIFCVRNETYNCDANELICNWWERMMIQNVCKYWL